MWIETDSDLDPLRDHPRYPALMDGSSKAASALA